MTNEFKIKKGLVVTGSGGTLLDVQGSVGQLFSVTDSLTGDLFSVSDVSGIPIFNVNANGTVDIDGDLNLLNDNDKIQLGDSQDLQLYHDGTNSLIKDNGTGGLIINANGANRLSIISDVHILGGTDFAIAAGRKLYLDGQSNTYITESSADTIKFFTGGTEVLQLANNTATFAGDIYIPEYIYHSGDTNTYIRFTADTQTFRTGGDDRLILTNTTATFAGAISTPTGSTFAGAIKITEAGTAQHILIGNQDSGGTDKPAMIRGVNGQLNLGFGNSWSSEGGTMTDTLSLDVSNNATFHGNVTAGSNSLTAGSLDINGNADISGTLNIGDDLVMTGPNPTISILDNDSNADDFYIHINSNNFYVLTNRTDSPADQVNTGWETPHVLQLESDTNIGYLFGHRIFNENYHPNADIWTNARTITLGGDLSGSVSINGSANVTLTAAVANDSHTHDGRYFTETESNAKFLTKDGSAREWVFEVNDEGNISGNKWYKVATVNKGNGGLHIRGLFSNHVESFASQKVDIGMVGREGGANDTLEVTGTVDVLHRAATGSDNCGIRIVEADITSSAHYHYFDVYVKTTRYQMLRLHLTKSGNTTFHTSPTVVTTEPVPVSGGTTGLEIDTSTYVEGNYLISNSAPVLTATTTGTSVVGSLTAAADVIAYSDERLKENVKTLDGSKVLQMRGVSFDRLDNGKYSSGVIAQELEKVAPELVIDDGKYKGVAYGNITGYLIEAIKEQQKQINELKSQMTTCNKTNCNCNCKN